jgi:hypothetical protein
MDVYQAIRIRALRSVLSPDSSYLIRKIIRWYSKTFHMPLAQVEDIPIEDLLQAYWEERYEGMSEDQLAAEREELLTSPEARYERILAEEAEEAEMFEMGKIVAAEEAAKKRAQVSKPSDQPLTPLQHQTPQPIRELPEADLPVTKLPKEMPPGITMTFVDDATFEAELEGYGTMAQPERKS